jgi:hypothetical protein
MLMSASSSSSPRHRGSQGINVWRIRNARRPCARKGNKNDIRKSDAGRGHRECRPRNQSESQPIDEASSKSRKAIAG